MSDDWRLAHKKTMSEFLGYINRDSDSFVLKGGTALLFCYGLDRFSEDIDLDGKHKNLVGLVKKFCEEYGYGYRVAKQTDTVQRCMIDYGGNGKPLKIEASFRRREIKPEETLIINGIKVYSLDALCSMKVNAYAGRDRLRDLYDAVFIHNNYFEQLSPQVIFSLSNVIEHKGIEQFDYLVRTQGDDLIDSEQLAEEFLKMYSSLGLLMDDHERELLAKSKSTIGKDDV